MIKDLIQQTIVAVSQEKEGNMVQQQQTIRLSAGNEIQLQHISQKSRLLASTNIKESPITFQPTSKKKKRLHWL